MGRTTWGALLGLWCLVGGCAVGTQDGAGDGTSADGFADAGGSEDPYALPDAGAGLFPGADSGDVDDFDQGSPDAGTWAGPTTRVVNQKSGPYKTIGAALAAAERGDTVLITDSAFYPESLVIGPGGANVENLTLVGAPGEQPVLTGAFLGADVAVLKLAGVGTTVRNLMVQTGGVKHGVEVTETATGTVLDRVSFDVRAPARSAAGTFGLATAAGVYIGNSSFVGADKPGALSGGVKASSTAPIEVIVVKCDFWGIGTKGGAIGIGAPAGSKLTVVFSVFGVSSAAQSIVGINSWGSSALFEGENAFRNIAAPIAAKFGVARAATDRVSSGGVTPTKAQASASTNTVHSLIRRLGCTAGTDFPTPNSVTVGRLLDRAVISDFHDRLKGDPAERTLSFMEQVGVKVWQQFVISWARQFDEAYWVHLARKTAEVRARPKLKDVFLGGYLMEAVKKSNLETTPIDHELWLWMAYHYPETSFRPAQVKTVNKRTLLAHWFSYGAMLGFGVDYWGPETSIPDVQKREGFIYYLYLTRKMIDAGINVVQLAQPQLTFEKGAGTGRGEFQAVTLFIKNYGVCRAVPYQGKRFAMASVATIYTNFVSHMKYVDYTMSPAGANGIGSGLGWGSLSDAYKTLPPASVPVHGKPFLVQLDNSGSSEDHISVFARAKPADRNRWLREYDAFVRKHPTYKLAMPGYRQITPSHSQNFSGYAVPDSKKLPTWLYIPFDEYGDTAKTIAGLFGTR